MFLSSNCTWFIKHFPQYNIVRVIFYLLSNIVVKQVFIFYPLILSSSKIISRINTNCKLVENFLHLSFSSSSYFKLLVIKICINFISLTKYGCTPQVSHEIKSFEWYYRKIVVIGCIELY